MTTGSTLGLGKFSGLRCNVVADAPERHAVPFRARWVERPTASLHPHPVYQELCGPLPVTRARRVGQQAGPILELLRTTTDGTILDGHARW